MFFVWCNLCRRISKRIFGFIASVENYFISADYQYQVTSRHLKSATFKMETPQTFRLYLQQGEWVTCLDFSDAYFYISISPRWQKYLMFHLHNQTYQFSALPFGLSVAPLEFKLMAQAKGIRINQYLEYPLGPLP